MKKTTKKEKMRDLLCFALNKLLDEHGVTLEKTGNAARYFETEILDKRTLILIRENNHSLTVNVWWGYKSNFDVSNLDTHTTLRGGCSRITDVCCGAWLELGQEKHLCGIGPRDINNYYCSVNAFPALMSIPIAHPNGYNKEGAEYLS